jgi:endonuclease/exonuclease/phosphatase family metal-dependent hydrolase
MKIVSWNMNYCMKRSLYIDAWRYLIKEIKPDIALLQECGRIEQNAPNFFEMIGERGWGTGLYITPDIGNAEEIKIEPLSHPGTIVGAYVHLKNGKNLSVFSLYGLLETTKESKNKYATTTIHRILSDMTYLFMGEGIYKGMNENVIIGGDLNISIQCDKKWGGKERYSCAHKICFDRIEDFGLVSCYAGKKDFVRTLRHNRSNENWQNDYIYRSRNITTKSVEVIENSEVSHFSDHNIVVLEIDV